MPCPAPRKPGFDPPGGSGPRGLTGGQAGGARPCGGGARAGNLVADIANAYFAMQDGTLNEDGTIGKQETAADSTPADQTAPAQTETGTDTATDPAAGTTDAAQETAPAGQDALDN